MTWSRSRVNYSSKAIKLSSLSIMRISKSGLSFAIESALRWMNINLYTAQNSLWILSRETIFSWRAPIFPKSYLLATCSARDSISKMCKVLKNLKTTMFAM